MKMEGVDFLKIYLELKVKPLSLQDAENHQYAALKHSKTHVKLQSHYQEIQKYFQSFVDKPVPANFPSNAHYVIIWYFMFVDKCQPWTCEQCSRAVKNLLQVFINIFKCETITALLSKYHHVVTKVLETLSNDLSRDKWKFHPASYTSFVKFLQVCPFDSLTTSISKIFPIVLWIVDDFHPNIVLLGVNGISTILNSIPKAEIRQQGRAEVIYDALGKKLYLTEPTVIKSVLPCILKCISVLERDPIKFDAPHPVSRYDLTFQVLLTSVMTASNVQIIRLYLQGITEFISVMKLSALRHFKKLVPLIHQQLESSDPTSYNETVTIVRLLVKVTWPRFQSHIHEILKLLLKRLIQNQCTDEISFKNTVDCITDMQKCDHKTEETLKDIAQLPIIKLHPLLLRALTSSSGYTDE